VVCFGSIIVICPFAEGFLCRADRRAQIKIRRGLDYYATLGEAQILGRPRRIRIKLRVPRSVSSIAA